MRRIEREVIEGLEQIMDDRAHLLFCCEYDPRSQEFEELSSLIHREEDKIIEMIDSIKDMSAKLKDFYDPESYESNEDEE